jgi:hypothetical protein
VGQLILPDAQFWKVLGLGRGLFFFISYILKTAGEIMKCGYRGQ